MSVPAIRLDQGDNTITKQYLRYSPSPDSSKRTRIPPPSNSTRSDAVKNDAVRDKFLVLAEQWRNETGHKSKFYNSYMNKNYQKIMVLGADVVPVILEELQKEPDHWFWALEIISGENPVEDNHVGQFELMVNDWIEWGKNKRYLAA